MATSGSTDSNIIDAEEINWRLIIYPLLAAILLIVGGFIYYYYQQDQKLQAEATARAALVQAKTPEELVKVADQFPHTDQATLALISAAGLSFDKKDYASAIKDYQRITATPQTNPLLRDSAQVGLASTFEASGKPDDAVNTYLVVAHRGKESPYSPFAYMSVARLYEQQGKKDLQRQALTELAALGIDSPFVKEAAFRLKAMNTAPVPEPAAAQTPQVPVPAPVKP